MGNASCIAAKNPDAARDNELSKQMKTDQKGLNSIKVLLLGAGESGKSTIFKQMKIMHGDGIPKEECLMFKPVVYENVLRAIKALVVNAQAMQIPIEKEENKETADTIKSLESEVFLNPTKIWHEKLALDIQKLWEDPGIQKTFEKRSEFQLEDCAEYFFKNLARVASPDFTPDVHDVLRCRVKTTGIVEMDFRFYNSTIRMIDVGGQRNERKKWIHCFEGVTAIIFVSSLSEYDQKCVEDDLTNRMEESLLLFSEICNSRWFLETPIILFLNKTDIFKEKISKVDLNVCSSFSDYKDGCNFEKAVEFVKEKFVSLNKYKQSKQIFPHLTQATDTEIMRKVFGDIKKIILKNSLEQSGFL